MGFWSVFSLVIGSQIGTGILLLPNQLAFLGSISLLGWLVTSLGMLLFAMVFSILCTAFPQTGGLHVYTAKAFGANVGFYTAWSYWLVSWLSSITVVTASVGCVEVLTGPLNPWQSFGLECTVIMGVVLLNLQGLRVAGIGEIVLCALKVLPLLFVAFYGILFINPSYIWPLKVEGGGVFSSIHAASFLIVWNFIGVECATAPAQRILNPQKTIPRALIGGTFLVTIVYVLNTVAIMGLVPVSEMAHHLSAYMPAAEKLLGAQGKTAMTAMMFVMSIGTLHAWTLTSGQVAQGAAQGKLFPLLFLKENKNGAPFWGVVLSGLGMVPFLALLKNKGSSEKIMIIIEISVAVFLLLYGLCSGCFLKLLYQKKISPSKKKWVLGMGAFVFSLWMLGALGSKLFYALLVPASGVFAKPFFFRYKGQP